MADQKLSRAQVGLALTSAVIVLLASAVAVSRLSDRDDESPSAIGPESPLPATGAPTGPAPSPPPSGDGSGSGAQGAAAGTAAGAGASSVAGAATAAVRGVKRSVTKAIGESGATSASTAHSTAAVSGTSGPGGEAGGAGASGGPDATGSDGTPGGGGSSPPAPSQQPPEQAALVSASVSAGEGAQGGVVGLGVGDTAPADVDVTVGTTPLVGDHPPSEGTGVMLGGELVTTLPSVAVPSG